MSTTDERDPSAQVTTFTMNKHAIVVTFLLRFMSCALVIHIMRGRLALLAALMVMIASAIVEVLLGVAIVRWGGYKKGPKS